MSFKVNKPKPVAYEFEITLCEVQPVVWRRFRVPANITFQRLHEAIQVIMGWQDYHMYEFRFGNIRVSVKDDESFVVDETHFDARRKSIPSFGLERNDVLGYVYDFGDDWMHTVRVTFPVYDLRDQPDYWCLDGGGVCPPEDVGGAMGYAHFLQIIRQTSHPEHEGMKTWRGDNSSPTVFDKNPVNEALCKRFMS